MNDALCGMATIAKAAYMWTSPDTRMHEVSSRKVDKTGGASDGIARPVVRNVGLPVLAICRGYRTPGHSVIRARAPHFPRQT